MTSYIELRFGDDVVHRIEVTDEQAHGYLDGKPVVWTVPDPLDVGIDTDGTLLERHDARPQRR
jgi:hypothetical protein